MTTQVTETPPREILNLSEATVPAGAVGEGVRPDGTQIDEGNILLHVIRPGVGRGRGRHLYEAEMLEENAKKFSGWKMFVDHLSSEARKAAGGLPRSVRDVGGRVVESWWDGSVPAGDRFGQGAVVAEVRPTPFIRELIENDPAIVEASISATATGVKPGDRDGQRVWTVEGIDDHGSVDWVTEAGAGGRVVAALQEAYADTEGRAVALFDSFSDEELSSALREERPQLIEAITTEVEPEAGAETTPPAKPKVEEAASPAAEPEETKTGEQMGEGAVTPGVLQEALQSEAVQEQIDTIVQARLRELVESTLAEERDLIHEEARANAGRQIQLRDLRDQAHGQIDASRLPDAWKTEVKSMFTLTERGPTRPLDVVDEIDEDGKVTKPAAQVLTEAVEQEIGRQRELLAAVKPTRVIGQGGSGEDGEGEKPTSKGTLHGELLQEAGFDDPDKVWASA